ncbi:probable leucine-rich repeat receptor-like protein kinase IMK3 [Primulina eburnea]|uniref:probable leucine-rich repeat receptor-like protein kinase IMK3 n=1 Tax=Primulina eburnea TaxID=1245227 RepID=UPI003C6C3070
MYTRKFIQEPFINTWFSRKFKHTTNIFLVFQLLIFVLKPVSSQSWDGIIVTESDYQALQTFKHDLIDPKNLLKSWNDTGYGVCSGSWAGIKCARGQVIVIHLPWSGLGGRISEKIGQLQALRELSLHDNVIGGLIPYSLGFLPILRGVKLFNNRFSGSIPPSLGLCPLLQTLDLGNNSLSGAIPDNFSNLTKLLRFDFSFNQLTGSIPFSLTQSASLVFLDLQNNKLSGSVNNFSGENGKGLSQLQVLNLGHNSFTGSIPSWFGKLSAIQDISLTHNQLRGTIPNEIGNLSGLRKLDLSANFINGILPISLSKLKKLSVLNLSQNNLTGEIPPSFSKLPNLDSFNVSNNNLTGSVPSTLSRNFKSSAFLGNAQLCGYSASTPCPVLSSQAPPEAAFPDKIRHGELSIKDLILILLGTLLVILLVACTILIFCLLRIMETVKESKKSQSAAIKGFPPDAEEIEASTGTEGKLVHFDELKVFSTDDLLCATAEVIGRSTYGTVYKTTMENGIQVAVKRLREKITNGQKEFFIEVNALGKIRHPNLLALRAYYLGPKGEKLLIFDYMPNGSLSTFLHVRDANAPIDWATRIKVAKDVARGLLYLHTKVGITHGNLTSSNVLLDEHKNAKISDYGLSLLMSSAANANVIATSGALGYRAPELSELKKATTKSDIYSFGVIMLELLTGKPPGDVDNGIIGMDLPQWVASIVKKEWTKGVFDVELMRDQSVSGDELMSTLKLALNCVELSPSDRPEALQILWQLEEIVRAETDAEGSGEDGEAMPSPSA